MKPWRWLIGALALGVMLWVSCAAFPDGVRAAAPSTGAGTRWLAMLPEEDRPVQPMAGEEVDLQLFLNTIGSPMSDSNIVYRVHLYNNAPSIANNVTLTVTLDANLTYLSDTSGVTVSFSGPNLVWALGSLDGYTEREFFLFAHVAALPVYTYISTWGNVTSDNPDTYIYDNSMTANDSVTNVPSSVWVRVDYATGELSPGAIARHHIQVCNTSSACSDEVILHYTLPPTLTLQTWMPKMPGWQPISQTSQDLWVRYPSLGGLVDADFCVGLDVTAQVVAGAHEQEVLTTGVSLTSEGDASPYDNSAQIEQVITGPWADLAISKTWREGVLVPGGEIVDEITVSNAGVSGAVDVLITDTLPVGVSFAYATNKETGQLMPPLMIQGQDVVWRLPYLPVGERLNIELHGTLSTSLMPGTTLVNTATVAALPGEWFTSNNTATSEVTVWGSGVNLRIHKEADWADPSMLRYTISYINVGDSVASNLVITDTYPPGLEFRYADSDPYLPYVENHSVTRELVVYNPDLLLDPGQGGWVTLYFEVASPFGQWFTNTVTITSAEPDVDVSDNTDQITTYGGSELAWVDIEVNHPYGLVRGQVKPGISPDVYVNTPYGLYYGNANAAGDWEIWTWATFQPGDVLTITAGSGLGPVVVSIPNPFTVVPTTSSGTVNGEIWGGAEQPLRVWLDGGFYRYTALDAAGHYAVQFMPFPPGTGGFVEYKHVYSGVPVQLLRYFWDDTISLHVDLTQDEVAFDYAPDKHAHVRVLGAGNAVVGEANTLSSLWNGVLGTSGFHTYYSDWTQGYPPDLQPYQTVTVTVLEDGNSAQVKLGEIQAALNIETDRVTGTINAPWIGVQPVQVVCTLASLPYGNLSKVTSVVPDGHATFTCSWDGEYDLTPFDTVKVEYRTPDGHYVSREVRYPRPALSISKSFDGTPAEGGNLRYHIYYQNYGDAPAENVQIIDTMGRQVYLDSSTTLPPSGSGSGPIVWNLGTLPAGASGHFVVFTHVLAGADSFITNTVRITTINPYNNSAPWELESTQETLVLSSDALLAVDQSPMPCYPAPGQSLGYEISVCNEGTTSSAAITVTDTLPPQVTLVDWWGDRPGWKQVSFNNGILTLTYPTVPGGTCEFVGVRVRVGANVAVGSLLTNTVSINSTSAISRGVSSVVVEVSKPAPDLGVELTPVSLMLTPGGELHYQVRYGNYGNVDAVSPTLITVTIPAATEFVRAWRYAPGDWTTQLPITPTAILGRDVVFQRPALDTALSSAFEIVLSISPSASVGTELFTVARIQPLPDEGELINNVSKQHEIVHPHGPNLRVSKTHEWAADMRVLKYNLVFENVGDVDATRGVVLTDTLPIGVIPPSPVMISYDYFTELSFDIGPGEVSGYVPSVPAGAKGHIWFEASVEEPARYTWYTNTLTISVPVDDVSPADNTFVDVAFSGTEIQYANLYWGWEHQRVEGFAATSVITLTTPTQVLTQTTNDGYFAFDFTEPLVPGDVLTLHAAGGPVPVEIRIPNPFTVVGTSGTGLITGRAGTQTAEVWVELDGYGYWHNWTQPDGHFAADFHPLPRGTRGFVKVQEWSNEASVRVYRNFMTRDILLEVNYAHDWVQGTYDRPGGTVTLRVIHQGTTYTATGAIVVDGDEARFFDGVWSPARPNITPGDTVEATTDDGSTTQLIVGTINATVDVNADKLVGTVTIPGVTTQVWVECHPWSGSGVTGAPIVTSVMPNGTDTFTCDWSGQWDIQPGQAIAVLYHENGNKVINVFNEPQPALPDVRVTQQALPLPALVGQDLTFVLTVDNVGDGVASQVHLTNTLPVSMTFVSVEGTGCTRSGRLVTCALDDLDPGNGTAVSITVRPQATGLFLNSVRVSADGDTNPANNTASLNVMVYAAQQVRVLSVTPTSAPNTQATVLTILGTNFSGSPNVTLFNATDSVVLSAVTLVSAQELRATVPANLVPGTYHLRVTVPTVGEDTLLNAFTVLSSTPPALTAIAPAQGLNTGPVLADIYGTNLANGAVAALRRTGQADVPLLNVGFVDSTHINATVPAGLPVGSYTLVVTNPNGLSGQLTNAYTVLSALHDLLPRAQSFLVTPPSPRAAEPLSMTITVRRMGGTGVLNTVAVDFYVRDAAGQETYVGRSQVLSLAPDSHVAASPLAWTPMQAGLYTLRAVIDPENAVAESYEDNNVITRTLEVLPMRSRDLVPPTVTGFMINDGGERTTSRQVYLNTVAVDNEGGSGVTHLLYIEYVYHVSTRHWLAVAVSGWLPYAEASSTYPWQLYPLPGAHYLQVWAADAAGNISTSFGMCFINWVTGETPFALATDEIHSYLMTLTAGQSLTLRLTSLTGDADLYVWRSGATGPVLVGASYLEDPVDEVSFVAPVSGLYLVEVYGYTDSTYQLDFIFNGGMRAALGGGIILPTKGRGLPTSDPGITPSGTAEEASVPSAPASLREYYLFLPVTFRNR